MAAALRLGHPNLPLPKKVHGGFRKLYARVCKIVESGCAQWRKRVAKPDGPAADLVEILVEYAKNLDDKLLEEQDPAASKVLALRIDESAQWLGALKVLLPHTNRKMRRLPKAKKRIGESGGWGWCLGLLSAVRRWRLGGWPLGAGWGGRCVCYRPGSLGRL